MINFHGDFKGFGAEVNFDVEASGESEAVLSACIIGAAVLSLGVVIGYGMATAKQWLSTADQNL